MTAKKTLSLALLLVACGRSLPPAAPEGGAGGNDEGGSGGEPVGGGGGQSGRDGGAPLDAVAAEGSVAPDVVAEDAVAASDLGVVGSAAICPPGPFEAPKVGARKDICAGFQVKYSWNEGPTWIPDQKAFFFSNFTIMQAGPGDMIKYDPATDKCEVFIAGNGCNGLTPGPAGSILATCQTPRALMKYDLATKMGTVLVDMVEGKKLDSPNDLAVHSNGTVYFSNTTFELGGRPMGLGSALLMLDPAGMVHVISKGGINPLGISPDQKRLYAMGGFWDLDDNGVPVKKAAGGFTLGGDGIAVDCAGNVYTASGAIVSPQNQTLGKYAGGTNSAFGGEDRKTLLVVGGRGMHTLQMNLPGLP
jgi:gluconolactonase